MRIAHRFITPVAAFLFALAFPVVFKIAYHADVPLWLLVALVALKSALYWGAETTSGTRKAVWTGLSWLLTLAYVAAVLVSVLITPYSSYRFWLENVKSAQPEGTVSTLLVILVGLVATMSSALIHKGKLRWALLTMAVAVSSLIAFIYQTDAALMLVIGSLVAFVGTLAWTSGYRGSRGRSLMQLGSLFATSLVLAAMMTGNGTPTGSRLVDLQLYPWLREQVLAALPRFPLLYAIPGYGYSFNETKKLGGTPVLSEAGIFSVDVPDQGRLYLRTRAYDTYDGKSWQLAAEGEDPGGGLLFFQSAQGRPDEINVKLLAEYYSMIPYTLDTDRVRFEAIPPAVQSGNKSVGMLLAKPIKRGTVMHLQRSTRPDLRRPRTLRPFLQVPADIPENVRFLAQQLGANTDDPKLILKRIEQYLALNYTYSLQTDEQSGYSGDFVTDFLFGELQGYCVHFATSFALLARLNGVPTRYTTGFLVVPSDKPGPTEVTGLNAHAWPEVWLDGSGWTIWEATPALNPVNWEFIEDNWLYNLSLGQNNLTSQQLRQVLGSRVPTKTKPPTEEVAFPTNWVVGGVAAASMLVLLFLLAVRLVELLRKDRDGFLFRLRAIVRTLRRKGVAEPSLVGWVEWGDSLERRFQVDGAAKRAVRLITETVYSHRIPDRRDFAFMKGLRRRLMRSRPSGVSDVRAGAGSRRP